MVFVAVLFGCVLVFCLCIIKHYDRVAGFTITPSVTCIKVILNLYIYISLLQQNFDPVEINDDHCNTSLLELGFQFFIL